MLKKIVVQFFIVIAVLSYTVLAYAAPINNMRFSITTDRTRIVLDSKELIRYAVEKKGLEVNINFAYSTSGKLANKLNDTVVDSAALMPTGKTSSKLQIKLKKNVKHNIFYLSNPPRLVIDFPKVEITNRVEKITDGVSYRYISDVLEGKPFQAYIVTVEKNAKYEVRPFSAAGAYNGRGSLLAQSNKLGLLAAINSSYFDSDGWVIGVTKDKGKLISVEDSPHSAFVVRNGVPTVIKDVAYSGFLQLNNGKQVLIKGMNRARIADDCVIYNEAFGKSTKTNQWGREIKLKNGKVIGVSKLGDMSIEPGTIVISGHGIWAQALASVRPGENLKLAQSLGILEADQAEIVVGGGPSLIEYGSINVRSQEEHIAGDIAYGRAPRTAVGVTKSGDIMLVVVDGRSTRSCGMTLKELANFMLKLGSYSAINFDGGGSSEMVVNNRIVNKPSDGNERLVSMGLGVFRK